MSESQTHTTSDGGPAEGTMADTPTETPDTDGAAAAHEQSHEQPDVPVTSAAEQETADAARLDNAVNGEQATDHAADGQPTAADRQREQ